MKANKKQRRIIKWAVFVFLLVTVFPPWRVTFKDDKGHTRYTRVEVSAIVNAPEYHTSGNNESSIASDVLSLEWVFIVVATGAACFFLNAETIPSTGSPAIAVSTPSAVFTFREMKRRRWVVSSIITILAACVIALVLRARHQAETIGQARVNEVKLKPSPKDVIADRTVDQLRSDADKGQADAQAELGNRYLSGNGVAKDYVEAANWFRKAAHQGTLWPNATLAIVTQKI